MVVFILIGETSSINATTYKFLVPIFRSLSTKEYLEKNEFLFGNEISEENCKFFNGKSRFLF